jgi:hypothetical protein
MVGRELELAGAAAIGGLLKRKGKHAPPAGTPCANCGAKLEGPYCSACGQPADDMHRSILKLTWEGIEGVTHIDGRLGQTLPALLFKPGKLAKDHFEGRRQRHVPPFRLFLVTLLVFMFVLEGLVHAGNEKTKNLNFNGDFNITGKDGHSIASTNGAINIKGDDGKTTVIGPNGDVTVKTPDGQTQSTTHRAGQGKITVTRDITGSPLQLKVDGKPVDPKSPQGQAALNSIDFNVGPKGAVGSGNNSKLGQWLKPRLKRAIENREYYEMVLFTWAHRLAFLLLPILAGLLALVYVRRRNFYIYDHLIVAMQFLSFVFLVSAIAWILPSPVQGWAILVATIWTPINLYQTLRGAYGSGRVMAVLKTGFLWMSSLIIFSFLMVGLMVLALAQM